MAQSVKVYKMRAIGKDDSNIVISIPPEIIEQEAKKYNLTIPQFIKQFRVVAQPYNGTNLRYEFIRIINDGGGNNDEEK